MGNNVIKMLHQRHYTTESANAVIPLVRATVGAGVVVGVGIGVAPAAVSGAASGPAALSPRPSTADPFGGRSRTTTNPAADAVRAIAGSNRLPSEAAG